MADETVLITGASSGFGLQLSKLFAADKCRLIVLSPEKEQLEAVAEELRRDFGVNVLVLIKDLTDPDAPQAIFDQLNAEGIDVDVVVNNAGFGAVGHIADLPIERQLNMIQVNVVAVMHLTRLFLPKMIERGRGGILNLGSTGSYQPGPNAAVYYATKAFVLSFTEALAEELAGTDIRVTCLTPGPARTRFGADSGFEKTFVFRYNSMDAATVARVGYRGFRRRKVIVMPGVVNRFLTFLVRLVPRSVARKLVKSIQR